MGRANRGKRPAPVVLPTGQGDAELVADPSAPGARVLYIGGLASSHVDLDDPATLHMDYLYRLGRALDVLVPRGEAADVVHLGGGAFALPRFLAATRPRVRQEVYELEPGLVELARTQLRLRKTPGLRIRVGDAADLLARRDAASADVIVGDCFVGTEIPAHLTTNAFAAEVRRVLRPGGVHLVNVVDAPPFSAVTRQTAALRSAFAQVVEFGAREVVRRRRPGNLLLAASNAKLPAGALERGLAGGPHPAEVRVLIDRSCVPATLRSSPVATPLR